MLSHHLLYFNTFMHNTMTLHAKDSYARVRLDVGVNEIKSSMDKCFCAWFYASMDVRRTDKTPCLHSFQECDDKLTTLFTRSFGSPYTKFTVICFPCNKCSLWS